jgi:DNA-directed RNA polymerase sigma subunit (sigma70/sigma32)
MSDTSQANGPDRNPAPKGGSTGSSRGKSGGRSSSGKRDTRNSEEQDAVRLRSKLLSLLKRLPEIERKVLEARMGLVDGQPMKPGEVASRMGMTIPEVKKIETRAFERIRQVGPLKGLERFLDTPPDRQA